MKLVWTLSLLATASVLTACSPSDDSKKDSAVENGFCTQATVDTFNSINSKARLAAISSKPSDLAAIVTSCEQLQSSLGGRVCKAEDLMTSTEKTISYNSVEKICDIARKGLNNQGNTRPAPVENTPLEPAPEHPTRTENRGGLVSGEKFVITALRSQANSSSFMYVDGNKLNRSEALEQVAVQRVVGCQVHFGDSLKANQPYKTGGVKLVVERSVYSAEFEILGSGALPAQISCFSLSQISLTAVQNAVRGHFVITSEGR